MAVIRLFFLSHEKENKLGKLGTLAQPQEAIHNSNSIPAHYIQYVTNVLYLTKSTNVLFQYIYFLYEELLVSQFLKQWHLT
jgi:hypothetical protein